MRELRQAGSDPAFLLKALSEASGELRHVFYGLGRRDLVAAGVAPDEDWCLLGLAAHMRDTETGVIEQLEEILTSRQPELRHVDFDDIPFEAAY